MVVNDSDFFRTCVTSISPQMEWEQIAGLWLTTTILTRCKATGILSPNKDIVLSRVKKLNFIHRYRFHELRRLLRYTSSPLTGHKHRFMTMGDGLA